MNTTTVGKISTMEASATTLQKSNNIPPPPPLLPSCLKPCIITPSTLIPTQVPKGQPTLVVGQEFLDALPVHQFQYTAKGWRERLVDINTPCDGSVTSSPGEAEPPSGKGGNADEQQQQQKEEEENPDFR